MGTAEFPQYGSEQDARLHLLRITFERNEALRLLKRSLEMREMGAEGPFKTSVRDLLMLTGDPAAHRDRSERVNAICRAIDALIPDPAESKEIVDQLIGTLRTGYDEATVDARQALNEAGEALDEADRTSMESA